MRHLSIDVAQVVAIAVTVFVLMGFMDSIIRSFEVETQEAQASIVSK